MKCDRLRDEQLDFLYGEADAAAQRRVEEHLAGCEACREELAALKRLRQDLKHWTLPEGRGPAFVAPRHSGVWLPLAAGFLLALGAGLLWSGAELRHDERGFALRVGRPDAALRQALDEHEARAVAREREHHRELAALKAALAGGSAGGGGEGAVLARVAEMLKESEARQRARLETTLGRFDRRQEAQRRYDLARVAAGLSYLDGKNGQQVARTTELMGYVLEAAAQPK
jgi:anti-sigma factor RsiW